MAAGILVFIMSFFVNGIIAKKSSSDRVNLTTECFNNIKMIKLFSWTEIILENID